LRNYEPDRIGCQKFHVSINTYRHAYQYFIQTVNLHCNVVNWNRRLLEPLPVDNGPFGGVTAIMDGFPCDVHPPHELQQYFYSGKEKRHVVRYLVVVSIATGRFVWYYGPFQGRSNDLTLVYNSNFLNIRHNGEWTLGDGIFDCLPNFLCPPRHEPHSSDSESDSENEIDREVIGNVRGLVERCIRRLKIFRCLSSPWRHHLGFHGSAFQAIINLVELQFDVAPAVRWPNPLLFIENETDMDVVMMDDLDMD